jgi:hypothetical protein
MPCCILYAMPYTLCHAVYFMPCCLLYAMPYALCHAVYFMPCCTLYAMLFTLCHAVHFMPCRILYAMPYSLCHAVYFMPCCLLYAMLYNLCHAVNFMPCCILYAMLYTLFHAVYFSAGNETTRFCGFLKQAQGINKTSVSHLNLIYFTSYSYEIHFAISIWCLSQYQVSLASLVHEMFTNKRTVTHPSLIVFFRFISKPNNNYGSNLPFICPRVSPVYL